MVRAPPILRLVAGLIALTLCSCLYSATSVELGEALRGRITTDPRVLLLSSRGVDTAVDGTVRVFRSDGDAIGEVLVQTSVPWLSTTLTPIDEFSSSLVVTADPRGLDRNTFEGSVLLTDAEDPSETQSVEVRFTTLSQVRIGLNAGDCTTPDVPQPCDFVGSNAALDATTTVSSPTEFVLFGTPGGGSAIFDGPVTLGGGDTLRGASAEARRVVISCVSQFGNGTIQGFGDEITVGFLSLDVQADCQTAVFVGGSATIENVIALASDPEVEGINDIGFPVVTGPGSVIRNSHFFGYFETASRIEDDTAFTNNTFVFFQDANDGIDIADRSGIVFANNVMIALASPNDAPFIVDSDTDDVRIVGNVFGGFPEVIRGTTTAPANSEIQSIGSDEAPLDSPLSPRFLTGVPSPAEPSVPFSGVSLDGVSDPNMAFPGAFQRRSNRTERRDIVRVGANREDCPEECDFLQSERHEVQRAVWSVWPGGVVEIYDAPQPYEGGATLSWPTVVRGVGVDISGRSLEAVPDLGPFLGITENRPWYSHNASLVILQTAPESAVSGLTIAGSEGSIVVLERPGGRQLSAGVTEPNQLHTLALRSGPVVLGEGIYASDFTEIKDVSIVGSLERCARFGYAGMSSGGVVLSRVAVLNVTCKIESGIGNYPDAGFDIGSVEDSVFANLVVEFPLPIPLFRAHGYPATPPLNVFATSISVNGIDVPYVGPSASNLNITFETVGDPLFEDPAGLVPSVSANSVDGGVGYETLPFDLWPLLRGVGVNGVPRDGRIIDRGAREDGS